MRAICIESIPDPSPAALRSVVAKDADLSHKGRGKIHGAVCSSPLVGEVAISASVMAGEGY
jgi:hypothetical protein